MTRDQHAVNKNLADETYNTPGCIGKRNRRTKAASGLETTSSCIRHCKLSWKNSPQKEWQCPYSLRNTQHKKLITGPFSSKQKDRHPGSPKTKQRMVWKGWSKKWRLVGLDFLGRHLHLFGFLLSSTKWRFCRQPHGLLLRIGLRLLPHCRCHQRLRPQHLFRKRRKFGQDKCHSWYLL